MSQVPLFIPFFFLSIYMGPNVRFRFFEFQPPPGLRTIPGEIFSIYMATSRAVSREKVSSRGIVRFLLHCSCGKWFKSRCLSSNTLSHICIKHPLSLFLNNLPLTTKLLNRNSSTSREPRPAMSPCKCWKFFKCRPGIVCRPSVVQNIKKRNRTLGSLDTS